MVIVLLQQMYLGKEITRFIRQTIVLQVEKELSLVRLPKKAIMI